MSRKPNSPSPPLDDMPSKTKKTNAKTNSKALVVHDDAKKKKIPSIKALDKRQYQRGLKMKEALENNQEIKDAVWDLGLASMMFAYTQAKYYLKTKKKDQDNEPKKKPFINMMDQPVEESQSKTLAIGSPSKTLAIGSPSKTTAITPYLKFCGRTMKSRIDAALKKGNQKNTPKRFYEVVRKNMLKDEMKYRNLYITSADFKKISDENKQKFINETIKMDAFQNLEADERNKIMSIANEK